MGRPKGGEKREKGYVEIFPSPGLKILVPPVLPSFVKETLVSLCIDVHPLLVTSWSKAWKKFVKGLRLDESGRRLCLEPAKG